MNHELVTKTEPEIKDIPGRLLSRGRIRQIYGDRGHHAFWMFVRDLQAVKYPKFCVSSAQTPFARDNEIRFFEIVHNDKCNLDEVMYLGKGRTAHTTEITNQFAADTWGFAVLQMKEGKSDR